MSTSATVIADSLSPGGYRLTTLEVRMHRFVLAEFNTHRAFSRNSASSRAIPITKQLRRLERDGVALPIEWPSEQPGMQGGDQLDGFDLGDAIDLFEDVFHFTSQRIETYLSDHPDKRLHKSLVNRLLEPFMWHTVIVTSTEWENFFAQRCSPLAQPEIRIAAEYMQQALRASDPVPRPWSYGSDRTQDNAPWHLPYVSDEERAELPVADARRISVARCARVSYLTHAGDRDPQADLDLYEKLVTADPPHWSPLEHVARTALMSEMPTSGNLSGWVQLRHTGAAARLAHPSLLRHRNHP